MFFKNKRNKHTSIPAPSTPNDRALTRILLKCDCKLERIVEYILAATQEDAVCKYCTHHSDMSCEGLTSCAAAVTAYLKERDGYV